MEARPEEEDAEHIEEDFCWSDEDRTHLLPLQTRILLTNR